jgi:hypothetical protein
VPFLSIHRAAVEVEAAGGQHKAAATSSMRISLFHGTSGMILCADIKSLISAMSSFRNSRDRSIGDNRRAVDWVQQVLCRFWAILNIRLMDDRTVCLCALRNLSVPTLGTRILTRCPNRRMCTAPEE